MSDDIPRPEHPRPDFHRGPREDRDWVNLNGAWEFEFDPEDVGEIEGWYVPGKHEFADTIVVPFPWESHLAWGDGNRAGSEDYFSTRAFLDPAAVTHDNYLEARRHETGWYHRTFTVPERWWGDRVFLRLGAVDYFAKVWVNGQLVCDVESGYLPLEVDITDQLQAGGGNHVVVRAHDPNDHQQQPVGKQHRWYARTSGIWQTVWLEPRGETHITATHFAPEIDSGDVTCTVTLNRPPDDDMGFRVAIQNPDGGTAYYTWGADGERRKGPHTTRLVFDEPRLWSPQDPYLYNVTVELLRGPLAVDVVQTYFAFREVSIKPLPGKAHTYIHLNGQPVYLLGALDQSFNPWGIYTFRSDEEIRRDIELARELGFNFLRIHIKAEEPRFHYWADRLGILTMADMPNFGYDGWSEVACDRWERTMRGIIQRDAGHPSIIAWCLFNETWGLGGNLFRDDVKRQEWVERMAVLARTLDSTRPVEDNSPCLHDHVTTEINSWHFYINDYQKAREHIQDVVNQTKPGSHFNFCPGRAQGREPLLNSEYGGISARMGDLDVSWCFHFLTNELRLHERICGYVYTELTDIEWERNGLLNYDRTPKILGYDATDVNSADFLALDAPPCQAVRPQETVEIPALASHFGKFVGDHATLKWRTEATDWLGRTVLLREAPGRRCPFPRFAVTPIGSIKVIMPDYPGLVTVTAWLETAAGEVIARNWVHLHVVGEGDEVPATPTTSVIPIPLAAFAGQGTQTFDVEGETHALWFEGAGEIRAPVVLPAGLPAGEVTAVTFLAELSSCRPGGGGKQTDHDTWPSSVRVALGDTELAAVHLGDQPADARGVLSHHYGFAGRYGELVSLATPPDKIGQTIENLAAGTELSLCVKRDLPGGLCVYALMTGRYPNRPCLVLEFERPE